MTAQPRRYAYLLDPSEDDMLVGAVIDSAGKELSRADGHTESEVQAALRNDPGFEVWVEDPANHAAVVAAWARRDRRERGAQAPETAPPDPAPRIPQTEPASTTHARQAEQNLCQWCAHAPMCIVADAARKLAALLPTVIGCQGFTPPPPTSAQELGDDLEDLAREPHGRPSG